MFRVSRLLALAAGITLVAVPGFAHASSRSTAEVAGSTPGTYVLSGILSSNVTLTMSGSIAIGNVSDLKWRLPLIQTISMNGYTQTVNSVDFKFSTPPDSSSDLLDDSGHYVRQFVWANPPANTGINVTETIQATISSDLTPFTSTAAFPVTGVTTEAQPYLKQTQLTQPSGAMTSLVQRLTRGKSTETDATRAIAKWIATHITFESFPNGNDAATVFSSRTGNSAGFANLMASLMRIAHIPAQVEMGWIGSEPIDLAGSQAARAVLTFGDPTTSGSLAAWVNAYFPGTGWVPFDPQVEQFFVDPRHVAFYPDVEDAGMSGGDWTATTNSGGTAGSAPSGDQSTEIVPGMGVGSTVQMTANDNFTAFIKSYKKNIKKTIVFTR